MICHCNTVDFKNESLCNNCANFNICKHREQFESVRNKLIEVTSPKTESYPLTTPGLTDDTTIKETPTQEIPPEIDLSNGIYLHMTCGHYYPCVRFRPDPFISPFKPNN